jgi:hypothetical protein
MKGRHPLETLRALRHRASREALRQLAAETKQAEEARSAHQAADDEHAQALALLSDRQAEVRVRLEAGQATASDLAQSARHLSALGTEVDALEQKKQSALAELSLAEGRERARHVELSVRRAESRASDQHLSHWEQQRRRAQLTSEDEASEETFAAQHVRSCKPGKGFR